MVEKQIVAASPSPLANVVAGWATWAPQHSSALRIVAAFMFIQFSTMKLFAFPIGIPPEGGPAPLFSQAGLAGVLETFGGALLLLGLFTRPVAFLLSGEMAFAYFLAAVPLGFWPIMNGGVTPAPFCFIWLNFSAAGAGPWSLDALRAAARLADAGREAEIPLSRPYATPAAKEELSG